DLNQFFSNNFSYTQIDKEFETFISKLRRKNLSLSSINRKVSVIKNFLKFLQSEKIINQINLDKFESLKNSKKIPKAIAKSQIDEIFNLLNNSKSRNSKVYTMVLRLMFLSGLRVSEALNLRWSDLNINDFSLNIYGKGSKERKVYLTQDFSKQLSHLKSNSIFIFHIKNKPISTRTINKFLNDSFKNGIINKSLSSHIFRHSFATTMLENNADIRHIQKLLGHSSISTTEIYTKVAKSLKKNVLDSYHPLKNKL
ncbi:tyrosine-type recombinase/integrase, partial [Alphaproteobacteria bacterium]|nr:tyrosine-type recombinase/integrase [Alphaproteobacteria bacterium]